MRVCYLLQTHKQPEQVYRLIRIIKQLSPTSLVVVSHDATKCTLEENRLNDLEGVKLFLVKGGRGDFSTVQGYLNIVEWLVTQKVEFDWLINITGQDYPIQPLSVIEQFLAETEFDGFIEHFKVFSKESHWSIREGRTRYLFRYRKYVENFPEWQKKILNLTKIINYIQPFFRINFARGLMLGTRITPPYHHEFICYGGSFFCTLSKRSVYYLYNFIQENPVIMNYFKGVSPCDEVVLQTILVNNKQLRLSGDCKRYFDFSETRNGHPRILTMSDYPALLHSNAHFARKFDIAKDEQVLDELDRKLLASVGDLERVL